MTTATMVDDTRDEAVRVEPVSNAVCESISCGRDADPYATVTMAEESVCWEKVVD